jgi:ATP-binding cassette subfamily B protein
MLLNKYLNKYYLRFWYFYVLGIIALVAVDAAQLYEPEYLGQIVDYLSGDTVSDGFAFVSDRCLRLLVIAAVMFTGRMVWRFTLFNASQRTEAGLRREMFQKSERLSQKYYHETKVGAIMSWFTTDLETIEEYLGFGTVSMIDAIFLGVMVVIRMIRMDWVLSLFAFVPMLLIVVWGALVEKWMAMKWEQRQKEYDSLYDFTQENFTGIRVIKAFVKETAELRQFVKVAKKNRDANISFVKVSVFFDAVIEVIIASILAMVIGFGAWFVASFAGGSPVVLFGHEVDLTAGNLVTFIGYFDVLIWPLIATGMLVTMFSRARTSMKRIASYMDAEEDVSDPENAVALGNVRGEIEFRNCTFSYPSKPGVTVLDGVSFSVRAGETVGIVGRIGSGKSTVAALLTRLYNLEPGTLFIDGRDVMDCTLASVRAAVALVPQDSFLFSDTLSGNIAFADPGATEERIRAAAEFADVAGNIEAFPDGYATVTGERGVTLSGGQKQRVSLARAYLKDAPIMILDDSVSAVDVKTEETILRNIREKRAGRTTIVIASRVSTVQHMSRVLVLDEGRVEAFDTPERLAEISPTYRKMVLLQELEAEVKGGGV